MSSERSRSSVARRPTQQRARVLEIVEESEAFLSAQDVHHKLRSRGETVGLSTVYRNLQVLADEGTVDTLRNEDGEVMYRLCTPKHHHHLVCRSCGRVVEIKGPAVERWADRAAEEHGYRDVAHTVEIFGVCSSC
ncbi:Fur family transcriptional regulator [Nocardioides sp. R-C-SC26]|uniref:Fur family transcriptional regulator n=1 Tax=Nocardioides sp. R-C-SC26 TaxID=2870414 RepID=UPI001E32E2BE|nr:Fur family transcriptional regulator [Nocardioides sp. R-C-SC26]